MHVPRIDSLLVLVLGLILALIMIFFVCTRSRSYRPRSREDALLLLQQLHSTLRLSHGTFEDEFPEQVMAAQYLQADDLVLELGGNIGRNSLVISHLLKDSRQLVTLETDPTIADQLHQNREQNGLGFHIVCAALSAQRLIQSGWTTETMPSDQRIPEGYQEVKTVDYTSLCQSFAPHGFTALVADCEGALYYILRDFPELLQTVRTVVMENDYTDRSHKTSVDDSLRRAGFQCVYREAGGWGPCVDCFFEVWQK